MNRGGDEGQHEVDEDRRGNEMDDRRIKGKETTGKEDEEE